MESRAPPGGSASVHGPGRNRSWLTLVKAALGVALVVALVYLGRIDLGVLLNLTGAPWAVTMSAGLVLLSLPLAALRWDFLLRALKVSIPFRNLFHFVAIGALVNIVLLGTVGGDAVRGIYAWRALGRSGARVALSLLADRLCALFGVLLIALAFILLNWDRMQQVPTLAVLSAFVLVTAAVSIIGACALFLAPGLTRPLERYLSRWPRLVELIVQSSNLVLMLRTRPLLLSAALVLALATQLLSVAALVVIAEVVKIGVLSAADFMFAVPLTLVVNALPLTPNGLGVGEAAFDQICRWLEPVPSGAAYSSIFFAVRIIAMVAGIPGLVSLAIYRSAKRSGRVE